MHVRYIVIKDSKVNEWVLVRSLSNRCLTTERISKSRIARGCVIQAGYVIPGYLCYEAAYSVAGDVLEVVQKDEGAKEERKAVGGTVY